MFRGSQKRVTVIALVACTLSLVGALPVAAADEYIVPRTPTADTERGALRYADNFFSGITGIGDNVLDLVAGASGLVFHTGGQLMLLLSDGLGLVDDNPLTRTFFHGFVSQNFAEIGLWWAIAGTQQIEINHDLNIEAWPPRREWYLRTDDGGDGFNFIDYFHCSGGYQCIWTLPLKATAILVADGLVRPLGNVARVFSLSASDDMEAWGLDIIEGSIMICEPDIEVPMEVVVEIREVPVETEVVREVFRTVITDHFTFRDVLFRLDDDQLTPMGERVCDQIAEALAGKNITEMVITGSTCDRGTDEYNMALGQRRADTVMAALAARGLDSDVMSTVSLGESDPIVPNENESMRSLNRRVEVQVTYIEED
ncbi:OmpA family protein [Candidatus Sumerlaeota bacterium]|nr:OmpA family protein [Candidatus Sumerlaeota bacterium]